MRQKAAKTSLQTTVCSVASPLAVHLEDLVEALASADSIAERGPERVCGKAKR